MALTLCAASCQRSLEPSEGGPDIRFVADAMSPQTRTAYSGEVIYSGGDSELEAVDWGDADDRTLEVIDWGNNGDDTLAPVDWGDGNLADTDASAIVGSDWKERIDWVSGDRISIYSPEAYSAKSAAYVVSDETHVSGSPFSSSELSAVIPKSVLQWGGEGKYHFYARYPDPAWSGAPAESDFTSQETASTDFVCVIPAQQSVTRDADSFTYKPDMGYCYMTAYAEAVPRSEIALHFTPVVSAFEIIIPNDFPEGQFSVSEVKLESSAHRLSGSYTVQIGETPHCTVSDASLTEADRTASAVIDSPEAVPSGTDLVVTIFTCPVRIAGTPEDHLTLSIKLTNGLVRTLRLKRDGRWLSYAPGGKYRIHCGAVNFIPTFTAGSDGHQVLFAPGNLQYIGSAETPYWKFADNQWEYLGNNGQGSSATNVDRDLFGWGTGDAPNKVSQETEDYPGFTDWGINPISNGGGYSWRTPERVEMAYIIYSRSCSPKSAKASVAGINGCILFPDVYVHPAGVADIVFNNNIYGTAYYTDNTFDLEDWAALELAGCVFLPAAGERRGTQVRYQNSNGNYWSSTDGGGRYSQAYHLGFSSGSSNAAPNDLFYYSWGYSVRLIRDLN